ncbi:UDP-N-acetylglucosamine pyrophosphorylase [Desulfofarcimen acetoxidans DSM 771]|uniref:Bifunctional protein GlmU n=1 Tax=Desulfofarcimen acetoxidans (strain ATCC 49208 / DSM 771 / KCTC 5769 / VKM B-1644 / 5575) TaxID=485916 RepID=C8W302_DESAS|nr:bifunctional UDP-N-acetylglucosamine diphosphorylase/glucosamine-1-phosphate N-acetyltransferase GlmU [Desulfofarcimen acetoxidans]ACV61158.1 UDP-N-acetylglucosamine pyrophosphorylase [Desulfofarcimen acetoxidans DSM 771]
MKLAAVVLAAGKGTRMKSKIPKVLHKVSGLPMISHVLHSVSKAGIEKKVVVVGYQGDQVAAQLGQDVNIAVQEEQLGTAHALLSAESMLRDFSGHILVLCGDTPLIKPQTLKDLVSFHVDSASVATVLTAKLEDPTGYGRVIRDKAGSVAKIVEQKDASPVELNIQEINTGIYCFQSEFLFEALRHISPNNAQGEYYLTDIIQLYVSQGRLVSAIAVVDAAEIQGINDRVHLAAAESVLRRQMLDKLMLGGVTVIDPASTFIDQTVEIGTDTVILPYTCIEGNTVIGSDCIIGPHTRLSDTRIGNCVEIQNSVLLKSDVGDQSSIGPFAYIRPDTVIGEQVKVGDFVEIKKSNIGNKSKIPHLSYIGDSEIAENVNIGAGTITCNYDGVAKHRTTIEEGAFIGSNTNLVAPVSVGAGAVIGAGSTITMDVPPGALGVARGKQKNINNWLSRKTPEKRD